MQIDKELHREILGFIALQIDPNFEYPISPFLS